MKEDTQVGHMMYEPQTATHRNLLLLHTYLFCQSASLPSFKNIIYNEKQRFAYFFLVIHCHHF